MGMEDVYTYAREIDQVQILYGVIGILIVAMVGLLGNQWHRLRAPHRRRARMKSEREKQVRLLGAKHIYGALRYVIQDNEITVAEGEYLVRLVGLGLPEILPEHSNELKKEEPNDNKLHTFLNTLVFKST